MSKQKKGKGRQVSQKDTHDAAVSETREAMTGAVFIDLRTRADNGDQAAKGQLWAWLVAVAMPAVCWAVRSPRRIQEHEDLLAFVVLSLYLSRAKYVVCLATDAADDAPALTPPPCHFFGLVAWRRVRDYLRQVYRHRRERLLGQDFLDSVADPRTAENDRPSLSDAEEKAMRKVLSKQSPRNRNIFGLYLEGWSRENIAAEVGTTTGNVRVVLHRLRTEMQEIAEGKN